MQNVGVDLGGAAQGIGGEKQEVTAPLLPRTQVADQHAQHIKVIALLKLDRYADCLRVFEEAGDGLKTRAALEYAYVLYKSGQPEGAIEVVSKVTGNRGALHLEAQAVCYPCMCFIP